MPMPGPPPPKRPVGNRLGTAHDPAVRMALARKCPVCKAEPKAWCVGVSSGRMRGRQLTRIHVARCTFRPNP